MRGWGLRGLDLGTQLPALIDQEAKDLRYVEAVLRAHAELNLRGAERRPADAGG